MTNWMVGAMLAAAAMAGAARAEAQTGILPIAVGVRGGAAIPVGELGSNDELETGWGFEVNGQLRVFPGVALYAAWDRFEFPLRPVGGAGDGTLTDQGYAFGALLSLPVPLLGVSPWVRGGAIYNTARRDFGSDAPSPDPEGSLGYEVGGGLALPLGLVVAFTPAIRYRSYSPRLGGGTSDADHSYVVADLGLTFRF